MESIPSFLEARMIVSLGNDLRLEQLSAQFMIMSWINWLFENYNKDVIREVNGI